MNNKKIMKVLVTGADGFIGSHLTEMLGEQGLDVLTEMPESKFEVIILAVTHKEFKNIRLPDVEVIYYMKETL